MLVSDFLGSLSMTDETFKFANINMNFYTDSAALQLQLEQHIDKRSGKNFGPPSGRLIYFIDDLNLPFVETYGTQTPIALMRQHIDYLSWYDRSDLGLKKQARLLNAFSNYNTLFLFFKKIYFISRSSTASIFAV